MKSTRTFPARLLRWLLFNVVFGALLFGLAGSWRLPMLWAYAAVCSGLALAAIFTIDPELSKERWRPAPGGIDRGMRRKVGILFFLHLVVALLDVGRFHWSGTLPRVLQVAAMIVFAASIAWVIWATAVNRFFSPVVRIQTERGHHLITTGPYRYMRHPGYMGMIFGIPASALALGSWWSLVPALAYSFVILRRTALEDRFLTEQLDGYKSYAENVRYRLVPGIW